MLFDESIFFFIISIAERKLSDGKDGYEAIFPYERFVVAPLYTCVLFRNRSCIERATRVAPPERRLFERGFFHWARGVADVGGTTARQELELLRDVATDIALPQNLARYSGELYPVRQILNVLELYLEASILKRAGRKEDYLAKLEAAAKVSFYYDEPPSLFFPAEIVWGIEARDERILSNALFAYPSNRWITDWKNVQTFLD